MSTSRVSSKGAIVIPQDIRKKLGIEFGMDVNIIEINGGIRIIPIPKEPIKTLRGSLKLNKTALEIKKEMRDEELRREDRE